MGVKEALEIIDELLEFYELECPMCDCTVQEEAVALVHEKLIDKRCATCTYFDGVDWCDDKWTNVGEDMLCSDWYGK